MRLDEDGPMVQIELTSLSLDGSCELVSIGLEGLTTTERNQIENLVRSILPPADAPLGLTDRIKHKIDVGSAKPIKQRYYPVSFKIEQEMHRKVEKMLAKGLIRR